MAISLQKGQRVDLTKDNQSLKNVIVGLGWDQAKKRGFFGGANIDCDASVILLDENGKLKNKADLIYFGNKKSSDRSIVHQGDNLTGAGDGDDEQIFVDLSNVSEAIKSLVFVVNIYACKRRKQDFGMIKNAFIRLVDSANGKELIRYNLSSDYAGMTSLIVGEMYRKDNQWKFKAVGEGTVDQSITELVARYK